MDAGILSRGVMLFRLLIVVYLVITVNDFR